MSKPSRVPGTYIGDKETQELVQLLTTMREYIVSHEARLEAIEEFLNEQIKAQIALAQEIEGGIEEAEASSPTLTLVESVDEPTDDSEEG